VSEHPEHTEHIVSPAVYLLIFAALMVLTFTTVYASTVDLNHIYPALNVIVALVVATCKAVLVILFFMHALESSKLTWIVIGGAILWLAILLAGTFSDYWTRNLDYRIRNPASAFRIPERTETGSAERSFESGITPYRC